MNLYNEIPKRPLYKYESNAAFVCTECLNIVAEGEPIILDYSANFPTKYCEDCGVEFAIEEGRTVVSK